VARVGNRAETDAAVAAALGSLPGAALVARLAELDIAFAELNDIAALARHPHLRRIAVHTAAGAVSMPAPAPIRRDDMRSYGPVPRLGEHTDAVLAELAFGPDHKEHAVR
jgi:formyl-CoA transferase